MKQIHEDLINAGIAGGLVFAGAFIGNGDIELRGVIAAFAASLIVFLNKFKDGLSDNKRTIKNKKAHLLNFL